MVTVTGEQVDAAMAYIVEQAEEGCGRPSFWYSRDDEAETTSRLEALYDMADHQRRLTACIALVEAARTGSVLVSAEPRREEG